MKPSTRPFLLIAAGLAGAAALVVAATTAGRTAAQVERTQQRIDNLLKLRLKPEPLPVTLPNPFQVVGGTATRTDAEENAESPTVTPPAEDTAPDSNADALARYAAKLKIGGLIRINGQPQLIINDAPRKEGDFIIVEHKESVTYLQIMKILPGALTIRLNEATLTVKF
jgi:hypothetical protein